MPLTKPDDGRARFVELACGQKRAFPTMEQAEAWAARHYDCVICQDGVRMTAYPCAAGQPQHFHTGHMAVRP